MSKIIIGTVIGISICILILGFFIRKVLIEF